MVPPFIPSQVLYSFPSVKAQDAMSQQLDEPAVLSSLRQVLSSISAEEKRTVTERAVKASLAAALGRDVDHLAPFAASIKDELRAFVAREDEEPGESKWSSRARKPLPVNTFVVPEEDEDDGEAAADDSDDDFGSHSDTDEGAEWKAPKRARKQAAPQKKEAVPKAAAKAKPAAAAAAAAGDLGERVRASLAASSPATAPELAKALKEPKSAVNSALYKLAASSRVRKEGTTGAPKWFHAAAPAAAADNGGAAAAAAPAAAAAAAPKETLICALGGERRCSVNLYNQRALVNIRQYYEKDGAMLPGRQGISLSREQWAALLASRSAIDAALAAVEAPAAP